MPEPARAGRGPEAAARTQRLEGGGSGPGADEKNGKHPWADYRDLVAFCLYLADRPAPFKNPKDPNASELPSPAHRKMDV